MPPFTFCLSWLRIQLQSEAGKIIPVGNPVLYHDIPVGRIEKASFKDFVYLTGWSLFFLVAKVYNLPSFLESLITGVVK